MSDELSKRERQILQLIAHGCRDIDVSAALTISRFTVKGYVKVILDKLGAANRAQAVAIGLRKGVIE